jgi:hypothetical protein
VDLVAAYLGEVLALAFLVACVVEVHGEEVQVVCFEDCK